MGRPKTTDGDPYARLWRESHQEQITATQRSYYLKNKEKVLARNRAYRAAHKAEISKSRKAKYKANCDLMRLLTGVDDTSFIVEVANET
jgi:hypothetical protein